jgi:RHS repeat-associated protein
LQHDAHGSLGLVFDDNGEEVKDGRVYFEPFGARVDEDGKPSVDMPAEVKLGYTGHSHDVELGLIDMGGRVYDPLQRRFLTPDPIVADPTFGPAYNRYAYVLNNPIAYTDPTGYSAAPTHPEAATGAAPQFECKPPECFPLAAPGDQTRGTRPNAVGTSTGHGFAPSTGTRSEWGPSMSDAPKFDADRAASDELAQGISGKLLALLANGWLAKQGIEQGGVDMIVGTGAGLATTGLWLADPIVAEAVGREPRARVHRRDSRCSRAHGLAARRRRSASGAPRSDWGRVCIRRRGFGWTGIPMLPGTPWRRHRRRWRWWRWGDSLAPQRGARFTTFYHGAPTAAAENIAGGGLRAVSTNTGAYPAGSFFTHEASQSLSLVAASHWPVVGGKAASTGVSVVGMRVPNSLLRTLHGAGLMRTGAVPGVAAFPAETVFLPEAFPALNKNATFFLLPPTF